MSIFERVTPIELGVMFDRQGDQLKVKPWLKEGIRWHCGSVDDPSLLTVLGPLAAGHRHGESLPVPYATGQRGAQPAERRSPGQAGGYLFASGVDLDVRAKVAKELGWEPIMETMKEVYRGRPDAERWMADRILRHRALPRDWTTRYSSAFQLGLQALCALGQRHVRSARGRRGSGRDELVVVKVDVAGTASAGTGMRGQEGSRPSASCRT